MNHITLHYGKLFLLATSIILLGSHYAQANEVTILNPIEEVKYLVNNKEYTKALDLAYDYFDIDTNPLLLQSTAKEQQSMYEYMYRAMFQDEYLNRLKSVATRLSSTKGKERISYQVTNIGHIFFDRSDALWYAMDLGQIKSKPIHNNMVYYSSMKALAAYNLAIKINPNNIDALLHKGILLIELGYSGSLQEVEVQGVFLQILELDPNHHAALYRMGNLFYDKKNYELALAYFNRAVEVYEFNDRAWNNKGSAEGALGLYEEAIASYTKAIEVYNPNNDPRGGVWQNMKASALYNRGNQKFLISDYEGARADYNAALLEQPSHEKARHMLGVAEEY